MEPNTVSAIILNYNGREHLEACLASLSDIDFPASNLEIIVVDNASTDGSGEMVSSKFPQVRFLRSETNLGFSRGANFGAARASGKRLAFLNNDMRVDRHWLKALVEAACTDERLACVGSAILNWDGTGIDFVGRPDDAFCLAGGPDVQSQQPQAMPDAAGYKLFVSAGAALIRADAFRELGGFDPDYFMYHEDVDLCWRLWLRGYKCALSPQSITYHRGGASSAKLPADYVHRLAQQHTLFTLFKNLDAENIKDMLPLVLYYLLERGRWLPAARSSISEAVDEFRSRLDDLIAKRAEVQRARVVSDADIFSAVGHPFDFLLRHQRYEAIKNQLAARCSKVEFDMSAGSAIEARVAITEWLNAAHFLFEEFTISSLEQSEQQAASLSASQIELTAEMARKKEEAQMLSSQLDLLSSQLAAKEKKFQALEAELSETRRSLSSQLALKEGQAQALSAEFDRMKNSLSSQLAVKEEQVQALSTELGAIKSSLGWRLLSRYGRVKHRYLLPVYRLLGLLPRNDSPPDETGRGGASHDQ